MLCRILDKMQPLWVTSFHEHNSLLEHIGDEELSKEERKAAWENYDHKMSKKSVEKVFPKQIYVHTYSS